MTAIAALSPMPATDQLIADALNPQTVTLQNQPFTWAQAKAVARGAVTGDWSRVVVRARQTPADPPATALDAAILAAINAVEGQDSDVFDPASPVSWAAFQGGLSALEAVGDLSAVTVAAINALTTVTAPTWAPPIDVGAIQTARAQP